MQKTLSENPGVFPPIYSIRVICSFVTFVIKSYMLNNLWFHISSSAFIRVYLRLIKEITSEINRGWAQINSDNHIILSRYIKLAPRGGCADAAHSRMITNVANRTNFSKFIKTEL